MTKEEKRTADCHCCAVTLHEGEITGVQDSDFGGLLGHVHEGDTQVQKKKQKGGKNKGLKGIKEN